MFVAGQHLLGWRGDWLLWTHCQALNEPFKYCELKYDGTCTRLPTTGKLVRGVYRGDETKSSNVTANVKTIPLGTFKTWWAAILQIILNKRRNITWAEIDKYAESMEGQEEPLLPTRAMQLREPWKQRNPFIHYSRKLDAFFYYLMGESLPAEGHLGARGSQVGIKIPDVIRKCATWCSTTSIIGIRGEKYPCDHRWYRFKGKFAAPAKGTSGLAKSTVRRLPINFRQKSFHRLNPYPFR